MPKGMRNPENMPRGMCRCGGPTVAKWATELMRSYVYVCDRCEKTSSDCACKPVVPVYCETCGEKVGSRAPEGIFYGPKGAHVCKGERRS